ncbi:NfrA family protein [Herbaspirillum robiniae]|uniref:Tetratricopeptide repeat protein n=1 Tax=Herbaspirillum robiniae TaxID=2014887 RepID=A0ABX2M1U4_9BURK|nr:tetratricopeptide repeat protein [Herbaspirillum robiniae]NUU04637.1 tetratricopeptide repeat protein [Herbaspirillum robiniae]
MRKNRPSSALCLPLPRRCALALLLASAFSAGAAQAQTEVIPLPLSGPAYKLAQDAYQAAARGDFRHAQAQLHEAIRLRPDSMELRRQLRQTRDLERNGAAMRSAVRDAGYNDATAAYRAYNARRYDEAIALARRAVEKSPRNNAYWLLLGNALIETHAYDDAQTALAQGVDNARDAGPLRRRQIELRREMAAVQAAAVFRAQQERDPAAELAAAQRAVEYAPQETSYRLMLAIALLRNERLQDAEAAADEARARDEWQAGPLLLRAYARLRLGRGEAAQSDFSRARELARPDEQLNVRLLQADAELALHRPQRALDALADIDEAATTDQARAAQLRQTRQQAKQDLARYRRASLSLAADEATPLSARDFPVPALDCNPSGADAANGCRVAPGALPRDAGYDKALLAYQAMERKDYGAAADGARDAIALAPQNMDYRLLLLNALVSAQRLPDAEQAATDALKQGTAQDGALLAQRGGIRERLGNAAGARQDYADALAQGGLPLDTEIDLLARTGHQPEARAKFLAGRDAGALDDLDDLQMAYLASRAGENGAAQQSFGKADAAGKLPDSALEDAAYTAVHNRDESSALDWFKRSVDAADEGRVDKTAQQRFDTRRSISTVDREFGFIASLSRSGGGPSAGNSGRPGASSRDSTWQTGAEAYWRPFGYMDGRTFEVFGRVFQTLDDKSGGATGPQTAQATVGARWKPFASQNIVVSLGRLVPLGSQSTSDWLAQLAYSDGIGTDLRVDRPSWWTTQWYGEVGRYVQNPQTYGLASVQAGRSFRLDNVSRNLVVFPHLTLNGDYNSLNSNKTAFGFGPGVNVRYWFREDRYHAPRSYLDLSLQYRVRVGGDDRAKGFFLTTTLSY